MALFFSPVRPDHESASPAPWTFICLFAFDALSRSLLLTLVPLKAYTLLQDAKLVSLVYFSTAITGLLTILTIPQLADKTERRTVLFIGTLLHVTSIFLLGLNYVPSLICGLVLQGVATASLDFALNLYLLDNIPRRSLQSFEAKRLVFAGGCFAVGPWIGVSLGQHVAEKAGFWMSGLSVLSLVLVFVLTGIINTERTELASTPLPNPLNAVRRFVTQPRLRLAWLLAFGRNGWWLIYFIYAPIYAKQAGYGPEVGGFIVTLGMLPLLLARVWARLARRYTMRKLLMLAYGSTAFLAMTSVFMTFRHVGPIIMPGIMTIALWFLPLPFVFIISGLLTLCMAVLARYLPRGM